jgi:tight adherence protein B
LATTAFVAHCYLQNRRNARISAFRAQLEGALRTLAGGVRVGLGIRQALVLTAEQAREPAKSEFTRIVGLGNVGVNTLDAFDQLAERMALTETAVLAQVLRVQSQTGGDLATVLEGLAGTIRDRRRLLRRVSAITAQGRATAWLLGLMPLAVGSFIMFTQPDLREATLYSNLGRIFLASSLGLDALAIACLIKITRVDP